MTDNDDEIWPPLELPLAVQGWEIDEGCSSAVFDGLWRTAAALLVPAFSRAMLASRWHG